MFALFNLFIFPGFLFLFLFGLWAEYFDRKIYAKLQNRIGPPWFQPVADFIKLIAKEDFIPDAANKMFFKAAPILAFASVVSSIVYLPLWNVHALYSFSGDIVLVLYLLTLPSIAFFMGGWYSTSLFARIGSVRTVTQLFAYEVPLMMSVLAPAILANTWSFSEMAVYYNAHPFYIFFSIVGFCVALISVQGKLEKAPFDIPEAETEIVAGPFTEYTGRYFAMLKATLDMELVICCSLLAAVFLPFGLGLNPVLGFMLYLVKVIAIIFLSCLGRTVLARMRIDQMIEFCWRFLVPVALLQIVFILLVKGLVQ